MSAVERHLSVLRDPDQPDPRTSVAAELPVRAWVPATKFAPPAERDDLVLDRAAVDRLVERVRSHRLTLVVAQGGAGKTSLVAAAAPRLAPAVAWVRLDETDDQPRTPAELVVLAVDAALPGAAATALDLVTTSHPLEPRRLMGVLINDLVADGRALALVLDDARHLSDPDGLAALDYLIAHAPASLRLVATARRAPSLRLARLRAAGQLTEVGPDELRFDAARAEALLVDRLGLAIDRAHIAELVRATGGWVTALVLSASAGGHDSIGSRQALGQYLDHELLASEAERVREFLLATGVLDVVDIESARTLTGRDDAGDILADLRRRLWFLVDEVDGCYRYHGLLRDHLRDALRRDPEAWRLASARAAEALPPGPERVDHLLAAGADSRAAAEIASLARGQQVEAVLLDRVLGWADQIDPVVRAEHPWVDLAAVAALMHRGRSDLATPLLESLMARSGEADFQLRWLALRHLFHATRDDARVGPLLRAMEADPRFDELPVRARVEAGIGAAWGALWSGNGESAQRKVDAVRSLVRQRGDRGAAEVLAVHYSAPLTAWSDGPAALAEHARWALQAFGADSATVRVGGALQLASAELLTGTGPATVALSPGEQELAAGVPYWAGTLVWLRAVRARVRDDLVATATAVAESADLLPSSNPLALTWRTSLAPLAASALRQLDRAVEVEELERDVWHLGVAHERPIRELALLLVEAQRAWAAGELDRAEEALRTAIENRRGIEIVTMLAPEAELAVLLAERGRLDDAVRAIVPLLDRVAPSRSWARLAASGRGLVPVLERIQGSRRAAAVEVLAMLDVSVPPEPMAIPGSLEVLTSREVEVLRELATGASNAAIGAALFLSENTVKTHLKRVLAKLERPTRTAAVARARELGLL